MIEAFVPVVRFFLSDLCPAYSSIKTYRKPKLDSDIIFWEKYW
mgnify:CR=1